jgi:chaperonin GroES
MARYQLIISAMKKKKSSNSSKPSKSSSKKPSISPLGDRVLIRPFTEAEVRDGGKSSSLTFILPDSMTKEKSAQGKVLAVGPGKYQDGKLLRPSVSVGEIVIFSKYGYDEVTQNGEELYLLREDQILAVIK